jgi:hypothetical protein
VKAANRDIPSDAITVQVDDSAPISGETVGHSIRVHPLGALVILALPLQVIVEDESSDGGFILWMARLLGLDTILSSYTTGMLTFRHAGGKGQLTKSARALTFGVWPRDGRPIRSLKLRAVVMLDSDARYAVHAPNRQIETEVAEHVAFVHVLERRTIENYVPKKYFRRRLAVDGLGGAADAYFRMSDTQQSYFPMRTGFLDGATPPRPQTLAAFLGDGRRELPERELYRGASEVDWVEFAGGFGDRLASVYMDAAYRCEPNEQGQLTKAAAMELNRLLTRIIHHL